MTTNIFENLKTLIQTPDLACKEWIYQQYDCQVMNDTVATGGDAAIVRVRGTEKALALTSDCTARYVKADPKIGAMQAVVETYRNISAVGGTPLAITNCLNFGNPEKPEIMGQIVRAIEGINQACKALNYPVVSGNVSLYNETDGKAIKPTPAIGGVGLLKNLHKRCDISFKNNQDIVFIIGKTKGHIGSSIYENQILKIDNDNPPPPVDLALEKKHGQFVRYLIEQSKINACHDLSDGGLLIALFEMASEKLGVDIDLDSLKSANNLDNSNHLMFAEDQGRYVIAANPEHADFIIHQAQKEQIDLFKVGLVIPEKITIQNLQLNIKELKKLNKTVFNNKFN